MMTRKRLLGLGLATIAIAVSMSACGGGGGTSPTVAVAVQGAAWVAYQDGANGTWQTLAPSGGFNGSVPSTAPDGRYSLAFVCPGQKPTVHVVHATHQELPSVDFTCGGATPTTITVSGTVSGLNGGSALVSVGATPTTTTTGNYSLRTPPGFYDVIAVRYAGGTTPNRVWLQRNRQFSDNTTYNIDFAQADGTVVRVFDVASGALTVSGLDTQANETATMRILLQSGSGSSTVGVDSTNELTPIAYPRFPSGVLSAAEQFRVIVDTTEQRGVAQVTSTLPSSLTITLPPPYTAPTLSVNTSGAIQFTAQDFSYGESPAIGYQMSVSSSGGARYEYFITAGWLGNANAYTTPVLETLAGWNSAWNLQRGESADVALRVYVSPSGATPQAVWRYLQGNPAPSGFILRYATRRQTLTP
jgi:hypothetical protein